VGRYILRRLLWTLPSILVIYTLTFLLMRATPGGPWDESEKPLPAAVVERLNEQYHLNDPLWKQYLYYLWGAVRGDLGPSYRSTERTVSDIIGATLPVSAQLGLAAMLLALLIAVPLGTISALKQNTWTDHGASLLAVVGLATPPFVRVGLLIVLFALVLRWLPTGGWGGLFDKRAIIPIVALAVGPGAILSRYVRSSLLEVIRQDYIRTARAKGVAEPRIILGHALRNALIPVVTVSGVTLVNLIVGAFFVETIYDVPGIGRHFVDAVTGRDYPVLIGTVLLFAVLITLMNLIVDIAYAFLDPRIRYG
jgi:ABC-type dipeptide/oligopeptide/nickel transport system permease component